MSHVLTLLLLALAPLGQAEAGVPSHGWQPVSEEDGIRIYERESPENPVLAFRGTGTVAAPLWKVLSVIIDSKRAPDWVSDLEDARLVRVEGPFDYVEYYHIRTPFIVKDRDFVSHVHIDLQPGGKQVVLTVRSVEDPDAPPTDRYVRGETLASRFILTSHGEGKETELDAEMQVDPKGSIPKWLVNLVQKSLPVKTFRGIRTQVARDDVTPPSEFEALMRKLAAY